MVEEWKDILDYEGLYQVSNLGRVKSLSNSKYRKEKILKGGINDKGYFTVCLKRKTYSIHRLVAQAFIDNKENLNVVNHIDENKTNNKVSNLEWCTYAHNNKHSRDLHKDRKPYMYKGKKILCITTGEIFDSLTSACKHYNLKPSALSRVLHGGRKHTGRVEDGKLLAWSYYNNDNLRP